MDQGQLASVDQALVELEVLAAVDLDPAAGRGDTLDDRSRFDEPAEKRGHVEAIDLGGDYVTTGSGNERYGNSGQMETNVRNDMKGLSNFDQPHAFMLQASYDTGRRRRSFLSWATRNWNVSTVYLLKSGTPFNVTSGADGPGFGNVDEIGRAHV